MSSLRDGVAINTYDELCNSSTCQMLLFEFPRGRVFMYTDEYDCPGMINIETGDRYFGKDIAKFIGFPLHRVHLAPYVESNAED